MRAGADPALLLFGIRKESVLMASVGWNRMMEAEEQDRGMEGRSLSREAGRGRTKPGIMCCLGRDFMSAGLM